MLMSFVEKGATLRRLSRSQLAAIEVQFMLYLLQATTFFNALRICDAVLDDDQADLRSVLKQKLADMIEDPDCNTMFKPAILRLARRDDLGFRKLGESPKRTQAILSAHWPRIRPRVCAVEFPIHIIGPNHLKSIEMVHLDKVRPHASHFIRKYARFLTMGESTREHRDMVEDLLLLALRSLRWYYPFRKGLHIENTMRSTITNRGRSLIKFHTADQRARLVQGEDGITYNRETNVGFDFALNSSACSYDPSNIRFMSIGLQRAAKEDSTLGSIARFIISPTMQDRFLDWLTRRDPRIANAQDVADAMTICRGDYAALLAQFLNLNTSDVRQALGAIQARVA